VLALALVLAMDSVLESVMGLQSLEMVLLMELRQLLLVVVSELGWVKWWLKLD